MGKKDKASEENVVKVDLSTGKVTDPNPTTYEVGNPKQIVPDYLINAGNIASLCGEIKSKLPALRNLAHCQPIVFFCEESLRALGGLEENMGLYCGKILLEAQRAANSQGDSK